MGRRSCGCHQLCGIHWLPMDGILVRMQSINGCWRRRPTLFAGRRWGGLVQYDSRCSLSTVGWRPSKWQRTQRQPVQECDFWSLRPQLLGSTHRRYPGWNFQDNYDGRNSTLLLYVPMDPRLDTVRRPLVRDDSADQLPHLRRWGAKLFRSRKLFQHRDGLQIPAPRRCKLFTLRRILTIFRGRHRLYRLPKTRSSR